MAFVFVCAALTIGACGDDDDDDEPLTPQEVFEAAEGSVVQLTGRVGDAYGGGTGFIYDAERRLALTNAHVVNGIAAIRAQFNAEESIPTHVLGSSACNDLAVVELESVPDGTEALPFGDSGAVQHQDEVTALGYPGNLLTEDVQKRELTSTVGTVSSPSVTGSFDPGYPRVVNAIQHDATINSGNSGGPLLNDRAEVIGVNTLGNDEAENQFYAISSNQAQAQLDELEAGNAPDDVGWDIQPFSQVPLGVVFPNVGFGTAEQGQRTDEILTSQGITGLWVWGSQAGSPAERARLVLGDLITHIEDVAVRDVPDVCEVLESTSPGQRVRIEGLYIVSGGVENFLSSWSTDMRMPQ